MDVARFVGESAYDFGKLLDLAIQYIVSQSNKPLWLSIRFGFALAGFSVVYGAAIVIRYLHADIALTGWRALVTTSCAHALEMAALLLDLQPGDEVIVPSFTFVSTVRGTSF